MNETIPLKTRAKMIDHSLLHPTMTDKDIPDGCEIAKRYDVVAVCVKPYAVRMSKEALKGTDIDKQTGLSQSKNPAKNGDAVLTKKSKFSYLFDLARNGREVKYFSINIYCDYYCVNEKKYSIELLTFTNKYYYIPAVEMHGYTLPM